jgi:hypothetical protein
VNLAFAIVFLWMGAAALHLASHGIQADTPWGAFQTVLGKARGA